MSDRFYKLRNGTEVQRDWYSSYLLYCYDCKTQKINKEKCGNVKILIAISEGYAHNRYNSLYVKKIVNIINSIKQHKDIINTLAQYIKNINVELLNNPYRVRIYPSGIWDYDVECLGNQGIALKKNLFFSSKRYD